MGAASRHARAALVSVLLHVAVLTICTSPAEALIKQSQLGEVDWLRKFVGPVRHARFASSGQPRVFVGTVANVVACLKLRDGEVLWRQVLDEHSDPIDALALLEAPVPAVVTLSGGKAGGTLRGWDAASGALLWERHLSDSAIAVDSHRGGASGAASTALAVLPASGERAAPQLAVLSAGRAQGFDVGARELKQSWDLELPGWQGATEVRLSADSSGISAAGLLDAGLGVARIAVQQSGASVERALTVAASEQLAGPLQLAGRLARVLTALGRQLCSVDTAGGEELSCQQLPDTAAGQASLLSVDDLEAAVLLRTSNGIRALRVEDGGGLSTVLQLPGATAVSDLLHSDAGSVLAVAGRDGSTVWTKVVDTNTWKVVVEEAAEADGSHDAAGLPLPVTAAHLSTFKRKDSRQPGFRVLATLADESAVLLQQGRVVWSRPEALAAVRRTRFLELPAAGQAGSALAPASWRDRLNFQLLSLKDSLHLTKPQEKATLKEARSAQSTKHLPTRDANGFRRLVLLLTASGKLAALHNGSGRLLWAVDFGVATAEARHTHLLQWRTAHDVEHAPQVLVLLRQSEGSTLAAVVDAHTGAVISNNELPVSVSQVLELPETLKDGTAEQAVYLLVSPPAAGISMPSVSPLPDTPHARRAAEAAAPAMHFWEADRQTGVLRGWGLTGKLEAEERWSAGRAAGSPALLAAVARQPHEPLHSSAKVLGDRGLKVKYLNPNLLLVASGAAPEASPAADELALQVDVLDAVTGKALFRQTHQGCRGPVHGVIAEHWAAYSYWNAAERRHQLSVVELYDAAGASLDIKNLLFSSANRTVSSYAEPTLEVLRESFFLSTGVKAAAVTTSSRGIASKHLLLGTASDQVYMLDKRFLDPRRPRKAPKALTAEEQAERLIPYAPTLPLAANQFVSYSHVVARLAGMVAAPAIMESTCHVFAHGLDLFYTRVAPAQSFDGLADDFPYALLVLLVAVMAAGAVALRRMARRKDVRTKWE